VQESQVIREKMLGELINYPEKLIRYHLQHVRNILQGNRFDILEEKIISKNLFHFLLLAA